MGIEILGLLNLKVITTIFFFFLIYINESESGEIDLFIGSFNVAGFDLKLYETFAETMKNNRLDLRHWLFKPETKDSSQTSQTKDSNPPSPIYVIGLQELIEIKLPDKIKSLFKNLDEKMKHWGLFLLQTIEWKYGRSNYKEIKRKRKYGTVIYIFVPKSLWNTPGNLLNMDTDSIKVGSYLNGCGWDKGAVAVRFELYGISLCFICAHLTSYSGKINERNVDFKKVNDKILFKNQKISKKIVDHDYIFFFGDLNYRINSEDCKVEINCLWDPLNCKTTDLPLKKLHKYDQLTLELRSNQDTIVDSKSVFMMGYREDDKIQKIIPTYMYQIELEQGYSNTGEKNLKWNTTSNPAWCDRVLYKIKTLKNPLSKITHKLQCLRYESVNGYLISDHKPIFSTFKIVKENVVLEKKRRKK